MAIIRFTILGCGSSGGVPRVGGHWGNCDPGNPKNYRRRCSLLVQRVDDIGTTSVLVDASPDLRDQLLDAGTGHLDGVIFTHEHADHTHGLDDLRMVVINRREKLPIWADETTTRSLTTRFGYAFVQPEGSAYPPILDLNPIDGDTTISGAGGPITFTPFEVRHGGINALGFRIGDLAYLPDVSHMTEAAWAAVRDLHVWILDALRYDPHPTHSHFAQSLEWIETAAPKRAILTNMHNDLDYATVEASTPDHVSAAYNGMIIELPAP